MYCYDEQDEREKQENNLDGDQGETAYACGIRDQLH